jgi:hypothetical protein
MKPYGRRAVTFTSSQGPVITQAILEEVTVCLTMRPKEPLAAVVLIEEPKAQPAPTPRVLAPAATRRTQDSRTRSSGPEQVIYGNGQVIRRVLGNRSDHCALRGGTAGKR